MKMKKRWRPAILLAAMLSLMQLAQAQTRTITGKVVDASGQPLSGVVVAVKGKSIATSTNEAGDFSLNSVATDDLLSFSHVGYLSIQQKVGESVSVTIRMELAPASQEEVVVIGYGSARKKDLTGAVATV